MHVNTPQVVGLCVHEMQRNSVIALAREALCLYKVTASMVPGLELY